VAADNTTKQQLGQFFTSDKRVHTVMLDLAQVVTGNALEPSAGAGDLVLQLETRPGLNITALELDDTITPLCATPIVYGDFFAWANVATQRYDLIFGNPPYVSWKEVTAGTRLAAEAVKKSYSDKTNLYHLFIDRCIDLLADGGELVFIVPKEWLYSTSADPLRRKILAQGAFTHLVDCGEEKLFSDASVPSLLIFRFVRGRKQRAVKYASFTHALAGKYDTRYLLNTRGSWLFLRKDTADDLRNWGSLGDQYDVRVGLVTGLDDAYKVRPGQVESRAVVRQVTTRKRVESFIFGDSCTKENELPPKARAHLKGFKARLLGRKIRTYDNSNWWHYGAVRNIEHMRSTTERFFALVKTRDPAPFFEVPGAKYFSGGVLGVFKKPDAAIGVKDAIRLLNSKRYRELLEAMSVMSADKVSLQPSTLSNAPFPRTLEQLRAFLSK
jgi:adenine-specific DNA-methyltransferase